MDDTLTILVAWVVLATIPAWIASTQGRSPMTWFGISVLLSPVLGFVAVVLTAPRK
jgi:uncharacterized membrane protein YhdT